MFAKHFHTILWHHTIHGFWLLHIRRRALGYYRGAFCDSPQRHHKVIQDYEGKATGLRGQATLVTMAGNVALATEAWWIMAGSRNGQSNFE